MADTVQCVEYYYVTVPITSVDQFAAAEAAGKLVVLDPAAPDPYQLWTTTVLIRPTVGPHP
jgi:hypothetical protein